MGKIDVAGIDQYTPIDVDTGAGTLNALPVTWRAESALGLEMGTATTPVRIDPTGSTTQPVSGTFWQATQPVSGTVTANAGTGTLAVSLASVPSHAVTNAGTFAVQSVSAGDVAHDSADSGNPVKIGGVARTADPTAVTAVDRANLYMDTLGKPIVLQGAPHDLHLNGTTNYTTTAAADVIAAVASTRIAVTSILVTNAHATVGTKVSIRDGTTAKIIGQAAAVGGGFSLNAGGRPLFITTSGAAVTAVCGTTGADVDVSIGGYKIVN